MLFRASGQEQAARRFATQMPAVSHSPSWARGLETKNAAQGLRGLPSRVTGNYPGQVGGSSDSVDGTTSENQYMGHWSWIYFDNNQCACNDDDMGAWDFIAECIK